MVKVRLMGISAHVAESNCVSVRRGEEQLEAKDRSVMEVNMIRLYGMASLRVKGEARQRLCE